MISMFCRKILKFMNFWCLFKKKKHEIWIPETKKSLGELLALCPTLNLKV